MTTKTEDTSKTCIWSEQGSKKGTRYSFSQHMVIDDGGRSEYYKGEFVGDCVARAISIASGSDYKEVYDRLAHGNATQRKGKYESIKSGMKTAIRGINTKRKWFRDYMEELGFEWTPTMQIGSGCTVHLRGDELPSGNLVLSLSRHFAAMINGVLHDTYDSSRRGTRCVYGYYKKT